MTLPTSWARTPWTLSSTTGPISPEHQLKTLVKLFPLVAPGGYYVIEDVETSYWDAPDSSIYDYKLTGVGAGRPGSLVTALKLLVEVINQRYAVTSYHRDFSIIDAKVDPDVAWITFAQNMVIIRKKSSEDDPYQAFIENGADESSWAAHWKKPEVVDVLDAVRQWKCSDTSKKGEGGDEGWGKGRTPPLMPERVA